MSRHFAYAIDKRYLPFLMPFGFRGSKDGVTLTDEGFLSATFGFFKIKTPLANVTEAHITGTIVGGPRLVFADPWSTTA